MPGLIPDASESWPAAARPCARMSQLDGRDLDINTRTYNGLQRSLRCPGERGFALLTGRWRLLSLLATERALPNPLAAGISARRQATLFPSRTRIPVPAAGAAAAPGALAA